MDYTVLADDVRQLLQRQGLDSAYVLGHSMGGKTAMQLALSHPDNVNKLIVADMAPRAYPPRHQKLIDAMLALDLRRFQTRKQIETALAPAVTDLATRQFLLKNVVRLESGGFAWRLGLFEIKNNYHPLSEAIHAGAPFAKPCLFIRGANSDYLLESDFPAIQRLFPKALLQTIEDAGHLLHVQRPQLFANLVEQFLAAP
jgi:esterase